MPEAKIALHDDPDFDALLRVAADAVKAPLSVVTKDYWLTEALSGLATAQDFRIIFKGGTSLSKGWGLIDRFSEDIDLLVGAADAATRLGQGTSKKLLKQVLTSFGASSRFTPSTAPGHEISGGKKPPRTIAYFQYPGSDVAAADGLLPHLKVELAIHEGNFPTTPRPIRSILAGVVLERGGEAAERYENVGTTDVVCLDPLRTFAEKVSLLGQAHQRGELAAYCRHYYDLYFLLGEASITSRLGTEEHAAIKDSIRKVDFLYETQQPAEFYATPGTSPAFALEGTLIDELARRYDSERIYYGRKPPFSDIAARISLLKDRF